MSNMPLTLEQIDQIQQWVRDAKMFNAEIATLQGIYNEKQKEYNNSLVSRWYNSTWKRFFFNSARLAYTELMQIKQEKQTAFISWQGLVKANPEMISKASIY